MPNPLDAIPPAVRALLAAESKQQVQVPQPTAPSFVNELYYNNFQQNPLVQGLSPEERAEAEPFLRKGEKGFALWQILRSGMPFSREEIMHLLDNPILYRNISNYLKLKRIHVLQPYQIEYILRYEPGKTDIIIDGILGLQDAITKRGQREFGMNGNFERMIEYEIRAPGGLINLHFSRSFDEQSLAESQRLQAENPGQRIGSFPAAVQLPDRTAYENKLRAIGWQPVDLRPTLGEQFQGVGGLFKEALWDSDFGQGLRFGLGNLGAIGGALLSWIPGFQALGEGLETFGDLVKPTEGKLGEIQNEINRYTQYIPSINNATNQIVGAVARASGGSLKRTTQHEYHKRRQRKRQFKPIKSGTKRMHWIKNTKPLHQIVLQQNAI